MRRFTFKTVALLASLASASTAFFLFAYFLWPASGQSGTSSSITFQGEVGKSLIQLGSVTIIGGFVAAFLKFVLDEDIRTRELARQGIQRRISLYNQFIERTGAAYRETKGSRRRLRSVGLTWKYGAQPKKFSEKQWEHYCDEGMRISEIQLRLEQLKIETRTNPDLTKLFSAEDSGSTAAYKHLRSMEKYLGRIVTEFEQMRGSQVATGDANLDSVEFDKMPRLSEFTDGAPHTKKDGPFDTEFVKAQHALVDIFQSALCHLDSG